MLRRSLRRIWSNPPISDINPSMEKETRSKALSEWIRSILADGLPLPAEVLGYMESTFGTTDLADILSGQDTGEMDSLLELILFPGMDIQIRYEAEWGAVPFTESELKTVQSSLGSFNITTDLIPPGGGPRTTIEVPHFALEAFVQRLNITWQPPSRLMAALDQNWPDVESLRARVHLRNARLTWHADQVQLANHFLTAMPPDNDDTEACLTFLLSILSEFSPGSEPFRFLVAKKFFYFQSLCKAEAFERRRKSSNMEIMMLQGDRAAHGNIAELRQHMQWIDRISYALFGRTHFFQQPDEDCVVLPSGDEQQMLDKVVRTLS